MKLHIYLDLTENEKSNECRLTRKHCGYTTRTVFISDNNIIA